MKTLNSMVTQLDTCNFFLLGLYKDILELRERITEAFAEVTKDMLANTWQELESNLQQLRVNGGTHVEVY